jgi:hypothetical protein
MSYKVDEDNTKRFEPFIPFFGTTNKRFKIYLHMLERAYEIEYNKYNKDIDDGTFATIMADNPDLKKTDKKSPTMANILNAGWEKDSVKNAAKAVTDAAGAALASTAGVKAVADAAAAAVGVDKYHPEWYLFKAFLFTKISGKKHNAAVVDANDFLTFNKISEDQFKSALNFANNSLFLRHVVRFFLTPVSIKTVESRGATSVSDILDVDEIVKKFEFNKLDIGAGNIMNKIEATGLENSVFTGLRDTPLLFNWSIDQYEIKSALSEATNLNIREPVAEVIDFDTVVTKDGHMIQYYRKAGVNGLFSKDENGKEVSVEAELKTFKVDTDKCNLYGIPSTNSKDAETCYNLIYECLEGDGNLSTGKCKKFLSSNEFWKDVKEEVIKKLSPIMAQKLLTKLEFEQVDSFSHGMNIKKFESVSSWLEKLKTKMASASADFENIKNNLNLIGYLSLVVQKFEHNPAILNPGYIGLGPDDINDSLLKETTLYRIFKLGINKSNIISCKQTLYRGFDKNKNTIYTILKEPSPILMTQTGGGVQFGGYVAPVQKYEFGKLSNVILANFSLLKNNLAKNGKSISPDTELTIKKEMESFTNAEKKLGQIMNVINTYAKLIDTFGGDNDKQNLLTYALMEDFIKSKGTVLKKLDKKNDFLKDAMIQLTNTSG